MARLLAALVVFAATIGETSSKTYTFDKETTSGSMSTPTMTVVHAENVTENDTSVTIPFSTGNILLAATSVSLSLDADSRDSFDDNSTDNVDNPSQIKDGPPSQVASASSSSSSSERTKTTVSISSAINATSTIESTYVNWVGSALDTASTRACYWEAHVAKMCSLGFNSNLGMCWAQCPYSYPVDDCALEIVSKV